MKMRSVTYFFIPFNLLGAIATLVLSLHYFHRGDSFGTLSGVIFLGACGGFLPVLSVNVLVAFHLWRRFKSSQQNANNETNTGAV